MHIWYCFIIVKTQKFLQLRTHNQNVTIGVFTIKVILIIITIDLLHIINIFETREKIIEYLFEFGLPKEIDMNGLIAVLNSNDIYKKTLYHEFRLVNIKFINVNPSQYDIPLYMPDSHRECSLFCTYEEKHDIDRYYKHRKEKNKVEENSNEDILKLPQPIKENNYCQLCDVKYDSYKSHIESQIHIDRIKDNSDLFIGIVQTLKRIRAYWNHSIDAKTKDTNSISDEISIKSTQDRQESEIEKSKELLDTINHNDFLGNKHYISNDTYKYSDYHMNKKESRKKIKQMMKGKFVFFHKSHKNEYE